MSPARIAALSWVAALLACSGAVSGRPALAPPSDLRYATNPAVYVSGSPIAPNAPTVGGGAVATYSVSPALPPGLTLDPATGVISGTPSAASAAAAYTVTAANAAGSTTAVVSIEITPATLPPGGLTYAANPAVYLVGRAISPNLPSSTGGPIASYSVSPELPPGLALDPVTGAITGAPSAIAPAATYTVTATGPAGSATVAVSIEVEPVPLPPSGLTYAVNPAAYPAGAAIVPNAPSASGGPVASYTVAPALPQGLAIDALTGVIAGVPAAESPAATYVVTARNAGGSATVGLVLEVTAAVTPPAGLTYAVNPAVYTAGAPIAPNAPRSSGGAVASYAVAPPLPPGLVLDPATGVISGTPSAVQPAATYVVTATNPAGSATAGITLTVNPAAVPPTGLAYAVNPAVYTVGAAIAPNAPTSSGGAVVSYAVAPALPPGLSLNATTGVISGIPSAPAGEALYTVTAANSAGTASAPLRLTVNAAVVPPAGLAYSVNPATYTVGAPIAPNLPSSSGGAVVSYSVAPALPPGLSLNAATGVLSGTPAAVAATAVYTVAASNEAGTVTAGLTLTVNAALAPPSGLGYAVNPAVYTVGVPITPNAPRSGGGAVVSYAVSPPLPPGLDLNTATGVISGVPAAPAADAGYAVTATNAAGSAAVALRIAVDEAVTAPTGLAYAVNPVVCVAGEPMAPDAPSSGGGAVARYEVSPPLPDGLTLNAETGVVSGTPIAEAAEATYTITATNPAGSTSVALAITVLPSTSPTGIALTVTSPVPTGEFRIGVDGGAFGAAVRITSIKGTELTAGSTVIAVPSGGPYRVRVLALDGLRIGAHLRRAIASGFGQVTVTAGTRADLAVALDVPTIAIAAPASAVQGETYRIEWTVHDPGRSLDRQFGLFGRASWDVAPFADKLSTVPLAPGVPERLDADTVRFTAAVAAPDAPGTVHFQVIAGTFDSGVYHVSPFTAAGEALRTIAITEPPTGIRLSVVSDLPLGELRVGVDGGAIGAAARVVTVQGLGRTSLSTVLAVPAGGPYRVRVIGADPGAIDQFLRSVAVSGGAMAITVSEGALAPVAVAVAPPVVSILAPASVARGETFDVVWTYEDPGASLDREYGLFGRVSWDVAPFEDKLSIPPIAPGAGDRPADGVVRFTARLRAPDQPGTIWLQTIAGTFDSGVYHVTPCTARGEALRTIAVR